MTVTCPNCGNSGKLPPNVGPGPRKIRCPKCGVRFDATAPEAEPERLSDIANEAEPERLSDIATELGIDSEEVIEEEEATEIPGGGGTLSTKVSDQDATSVRTEPTIGIDPVMHLLPDPWFYGFLEGWGVFYNILAGLIFLGLLTGFVVVLAQSSKESDVTASIWLIGLGLGISALIAITCAAVLFLIVDVARNVRTMRFHAERTESILRSELGKRG
jgi:hypothetical protein